MSHRTRAQPCSAILGSAAAVLSLISCLPLVIGCGSSETVPPAVTPTATPAPTPAPSAACADPASCRGRLANEGFVGQPIKTTLFFAGQANDGTAPYGCYLAPNLGLYTLHPSDARHLNWSTSAGNRDFALSQMVEAGINVVSMSTWGESFLPCSDGWVVGIAPMQSAPQAHDELFAATGNQPLLIVPFIESRSNWSLRGEFPTTSDGRVAPGATSQIVDLVRRYLQNAAHPEWAGRWARVFDRDGEPRHAIALIHVASDRLGAAGDAAFAAGFDALAEAVESATGVRVGFFIDALPPDTFAPGVFRPSAQRTGPLLDGTRSVLGIQCFIPEIFTDRSSDAALLSWKRAFLGGWFATGIPVIVDVSPGYDAHIVFPGSKRYGYSPEWREGLSALVRDYGSGGVVYNAWNGYTEGLVAVRTRERGRQDYEWLQGLDPE